MRLSSLFVPPDTSPEQDTAGITIDVMAGIVAGLALVVAILLLAASLRQAQAMAADPDGPGRPAAVVIAR
jgi:hypothetical protein